MSVYTCYDMVADCKSAKPEGFAYLVRHLLPPLRKLVRHYGGDDTAFRGLVLSLRTMTDIEPMSDREFVARIRPRVLEQCKFTLGAGKALDLAAFSEALTGLTFLERQLVWYETMGCDTIEAARRVRVSPETGAKARDKALELLRGNMDTWNRDVIRDNSGALVEQARQAKPDETIAFRRYVDLIDGRLTWQHREEVERAVVASWYEVDRLCVVREADDAVQGSRPLEKDEAAVFLEMLGVKPPQPAFWKRLIKG